MGGFKGGYAEYVRVSFADHTVIPIPDAADDLDAPFTSDSVPHGWTGTDLGGVPPGDVVALWSSGAVEQRTARTARLLGAERVLVIDRFGLPIAAARAHLRVETLNYETTDIGAALRETTGGRLRTCASKPWATRRTTEVCSIC